MESSGQDTIEGDHFFRNRTRGAGVEENPFFMVCALFFLSPHVYFFHTNKKSQITHKGEPRFPVNNLESFLQEPQKDKCPQEADKMLWGVGERKMDHLWPER